jgi:glutathione S-transferase
MPTSRHVTLFYAPQTRASGALALLEELQADYELHLLNLKTEEQRGAAYLALNPMGKVPALLHQGVLVAEQAAVFMYLADLYPEAGLAPQTTDPRRGDYLRWMVFYGSCFEPALVDRAMKRDPAPRSTSPYGDYDTMFNTLNDRLKQGPYLLGDSFTAADVLWGLALTWTTMFKLVPETPEINAYMGRVNARPAVQRARAKEAEILASLAR